MKWWISTFPAELDVTLYRQTHTNIHTQIPPCRNRQKFTLNVLKFMKWSYSFTDSCHRNTMYFVLLYCTLKNCVARKEIIYTIKFLVQKTSKMWPLSTFKKQIPSPKTSGHSISWQLLVRIYFIESSQENSYFSQKMFTSFFLTF